MRDWFTGTGIRTPVPWLRNAAGESMVSGCVGFLPKLALTFGSFLVRTVAFVRKLSRIFQVFQCANLLRGAYGYEVTI